MPESRHQAKLNLTQWWLDFQPSTGERDTSDRRLQAELKTNNLGYTQCVYSAEMAVNPWGSDAFFTAYDMNDDGTFTSANGKRQEKNHMSIHPGLAGKVATFHVKFAHWPRNPHARGKVTDAVKLKSFTVERCYDGEYKFVVVWKWKGTTHPVTTAELESITPVLLILALSSGSEFWNEVATATGPTTLVNMEDDVSTRNMQALRCVRDIALLMEKMQHSTSNYHKQQQKHNGMIRYWDDDTVDDGTDRFMVTECCYVDSTGKLLSETQYAEPADITHLDQQDQWVHEPYIFLQTCFVIRSEINKIMKDQYAAC